MKISIFLPKRAIFSNRSSCCGWFFAVVRGQSLSASGHGFFRFKSRFRGLEPNGRPTAGNARETRPGWQPDEIVLSQDRHTLSIRTFANTERGYDQIRVLTLTLATDR